MAEATDIQWADSTLNLMMGCDGCELWLPHQKNGKRCYAGTLTNIYGGNKGWPKSFTEPAIFAERLAIAEKWKDLTGTDRPDKPWLNGRPRMVFINDMGDTFTESLPLHWMEPLLPRMEALPHIIMILTKRAHRMREFFTAVGVPKNFWLYVSVTQRGQHQRVWDLLKIPGAPVYGLSLEPQIEDICLNQHELLCKTWRNGATLERYLDHVIQGGESGMHARPFRLQWARTIMWQCAGTNTAYFLKQVGARPFDHQIGYACENDPSHGGDPADWPRDIRVRQYPEAR